MRELLRFFGVSGNKGRRQIDQKDFAERKDFLKALGGDPDRLQRGEAVTIKWKNDRIPILLGMEWWMATKEGIKAAQARGSSPSDVWLYLLRNEDLLRLYVGTALLLDEVAEQLSLNVTVWEGNERKKAESLYFAAPYLRFTPQGQLVIPGGARIWQEALKRYTSSSQLIPSLYMKENGGLLY